MIPLEATSRTSPHIFMPMERDLALSSSTNFEEAPALLPSLSKIELEPSSFEVAACFARLDGCMNPSECYMGDLYTTG